MTGNRKSGENTVPDAPGMGMYETTHTSLLEAARNGNMTATRWEAFGMRYRTVLVRYAIRFYKMPQDLAENAVQDTLVKMWQSPDLIRRPPNKKFRYVLANVLKKKCLRIRTSENRQQGLPDVRDIPWIKTDVDELDRATSRAFAAFTAENFRQMIEMGRWPEVGLSRISLEHWYAHEFEEQTQMEIAADYGIDQSTVSRHINEVQTFFKKDGEQILHAFGIA